MILPFIWPNLQVHQEPFCHEDSRKRHLGKVESWQGSWCWILIKILQKLHNDTPIHMTQSQGSWCWILMKISQKLHEDATIHLTLSPSTSGTFCHEDSRKRHLGKVESWQGSWCWIIIKILQKLHKDAPIHLTRSPLSRFIRNLHIPKDSTWNSEIGLWWNFSIICQGLSGAFMSLNAPEGD